MQSVARSAYSLQMQLGRRPDTGAYYIRLDGRRISLRKFVGHAVTDSSEAKRIFAQVRREVLAGKLVQLSGGCSVTLGEFVRDYLEWAENVRENASYRADKLALGKLLDVAGRGTTLDRLTVRHIDALTAAHKGLKPASINNYIRHIRAAFNKAVAWKNLKANPFVTARELPKTKADPIYIEAQDVPRFLASIEDPDKRRMVAAYIYSGRRRAELLALEWAQVDMAGERYFIGRSKPHLARWYPMHPIFKAVLKALGGQGEGRVFSRWDHPDTISHMVKEALRGFGLGHVHLHHLRHTFATLLLSAGEGMKVIGSLLGHTDPRATEIYAHVTGDLERSAIRKIKAGPVEL